MKKGLCVLCAALLCTALVMAQTPSKTVVDAKGQTKFPPTVSSPAYVSDEVPEAPFIGPVMPVQTGARRSFSPTNRAPEGYVGPKESSSAGIRIDCPGSVPEGEPVCSDDYDDTFNGGCNSTPPVFSSIACGDKILGTAGTFLFGTDQYRDTDWYQITVTADTEFTWSVTADFDVLIFLIRNNTGIEDDCSDYTILESATAPIGLEASITRCCYPGVYWFWAGTQVFTGWPCPVEYCAELTCEPCVAPQPIQCPPETTLTGQRAYDQDESWMVAVSNDRFPTFDPADGIKRVEHFCGAGGPIEDLHWWGVTFVYNDEGVQEECLLDPGTFEIEFWAHDPLTNRPNWALGPIYAFTADDSIGLTKTDTGHVYDLWNWQFEVEIPVSLWYWEVNLPAPYSAFIGWLSIKNMDHCCFWWAASPVGGTIHLMIDEPDPPEAFTEEDGDLSYCLTATDIGPFTGACCDESEGVCRDTTADDCCGPYDRWEPGLLCSEISCPIVTWACCIGTNCNRLTLGVCNSSAGTWFQGYVCTTTDPDYTGDNLADCSEFEPPPDIYCDANACHGVDTAGGYLYISWDRGPGDQRFVIDNYDGCTQPIVRVEFFGNSTNAWDGPDYDPPAEAPFVIKFYPDYQGAPNMDIELCTYGSYDNPWPCSWAETQWYWTGSPELGMIESYIAYLAPSCMVSRGWISIAGADLDTMHDFIWAPGVDDGVQYFYDNGVLTQEPAGRDRAFCLYTSIRTGACCYERTGTCVDGEQEDVCLAAPDTYFKVNRTCASLVPPCAACEGACCNRDTDECNIVTWSVCDGLGAPWEWLGCDSTCDECCVVVCPVGGTPEGEPDCSDGYIDTYNYGCYTSPTWTYPDDWLPIDDTFDVDHPYCGKSGTYFVGEDHLRDLDYYTYTLTDDVALVEAHVYAEFEADVYFIVPDLEGTGDGHCPSWFISEGYGPPCEDAIASAAVIAGTTGEYHFIVSCFGSPPCGDESPYLLWLEKYTAGKCEIEPDICVNRSENVCLAMGGAWTEGVPCPGERPCLWAADCNCDGAVNGFDIDPFVIGLAQGQDAWEAAYTCDYLCACDCNYDGVVNGFDIDPFVELLTGK